MNLLILRITRVFLILAYCPLITSASDWTSCADDLDRLRKAASEANNAATQANLEANEFEDCKNFPEVYDLYRDGCRGASSEYRNALSTLENELSTVDGKIRSVALSCGVELSGTSSLKIQPSGDRFCDLYISYKGRIPDKQLMNQCRESKTESECTKCLSSK